MHILNKKDFYEMLLRERHPIAKIDFSVKDGFGRVEFINTPLGVLLHVRTLLGDVKAIKMYDRHGGEFELQNLFCAEDLLCIGEHSYVCISSRIKIEDVIGRSFLIKLNESTVISRAEFISIKSSDVDKMQSMVYN
jgi:hypothetical protein